MKKIFFPVFSIIIVTSYAMEEQSAGTAVASSLLYHDNLSKKQISDPVTRVKLQDKQTEKSVNQGYDESRYVRGKKNSEK